jgi:hypothetical protein
MNKTCVLGVLTRYDIQCSARRGMLHHATLAEYTNDSAVQQPLLIQHLEDIHSTVRCCTASASLVKYIVQWR